MSRLSTLLLSLLALAVSGAVVLVASEGGKGGAAAIDTSASAAEQAPSKVAVRAQKPARGRLGSGNPVLFAFGGDVHFEGALASKLAASPSTVLAPIAPTLGRADLAVANLETAVT